MKKISYLLFVFIIVAAYFSEGNFFIKQVHAATTTFSGMLTGDGPKFKRPEFPHDFQDGLPFTTVYDSSEIIKTMDKDYNYYIRYLTPSINGEYIIEVTSANLVIKEDGYENDTSLFIYQDSFDPSNPLANLLKGNDDKNDNTYLSAIPITLTSGTNYIIVLTSYHAGDTGTISFKVTGPGTVTHSDNPIPTGPAVNSVSVSPSAATVVQGGTQQLTATVDAVGGAATTVTWTSSDAAGKVTVDSNGLVSVAADAVPGDYTITATSTADSTKSATATITVTATLPAHPLSPQNLAAVAGNQLVDLSWDTVTNATYYNVYMSQVPGVFSDISLATVTGSTYQVQNLINGTTYYFIVKAGNAGGLSTESNEVSATPATVPAAPTNVAAIAGNGSATLTFTAPNDNGGSPITGYEVFDMNGNLVSTGSADTTSITITGLTNGTTYTFRVKAKNAIGSSDPSEPSNAVTPSAPSNNDDDDDDHYTPFQPVPSTPAPENRGVDVLVNGKVENAGTAKTDLVNGQQVTTIAVDEEKLQQRLETEGERAIITIPVTFDSEVVVGELNGRMVKNMENQQAVIEIRTEKAAYTLPASQINIDAISERFGSNLALQDVKVRIEIAEPLSETVRVVENAANREGLTLVIPPLNFKVSAVYGDRVEEVTRFDAYVQRTVAIPDGVDPSRITTGVVVEPDGTVRHVPTKVIEIDGKYYAQINSLTNSTYSVVWNPLKFKDMENHWAKAAANNMGSRMVVEGTGNGNFSPDLDITRAEFTAIVVRGLGLKLENGESRFADVKPTDWFSSAVLTAYEYGLIHGFEDGTFRPNEKMTREQAMQIIANAMELTGLNQQVEARMAEAILQTFEDADDISSWATIGVAKSVQAGIVSGKRGNELAPNDYITRAEAATIMERLLKKSELI